MSYQSKYTGQEIDNGINPIGTIIAFMGTIAPTGFLICDGSELNIADYPKLAEHFETQFGSKSNFGGDGTTTFALPDLRNEFLRGYHGDKDNQLSGEIGLHQEPTAHLRVATQRSTSELQIHTIETEDDWWTATNNDGTIKDSTHRWAQVPSSHYGSDPAISYAYYSRPTNVAVLYCIKY